MVKIFARSQKYRDNWDVVFGGKDTMESTDEVPPCESDMKITAEEMEKLLNPTEKLCGIGGPPN